MSASGSSNHASTIADGCCEAAPLRGVVVTVKVVVAVPPPGVTDGGLNEHAAAGGTPAVQENETVPVKPACPVN